MNRLVLIGTLALFLVGFASGQEDRGAVGFGIASVQTSPDSPLARALRYNVFLDIGKNLSRKVYYGFELQGDVAWLNDQSFQLQQDDVTRHHLGGSQWEGLFNTPNTQATYQLWDFDLSPRGYLSADFGDKVELLGFVGLNYKWQNIDYHITSMGQSGSSNLWLGGNGQGVLGTRFSIAFFYLEFAHYFNISPSDLDLGNDDLSRFGAGASFRF